MTAFDAVILAGGRGERMGSVDKAGLTIGGVTTLGRVLAATKDAGNVICVGPKRATDRPVRWTRERPPDGGPVAALAAGLDLVEAAIAVVLAVDLPFVTGAVVSRLAESCVEADAALVVDGDGIPQPLLAAYRVGPLRARLRVLDSAEGAPMHTLIEGLDYVTLFEPDAAQDLDTPADLERVRGEVG